MSFAQVVNVLDEVYNPGLREAIKNYTQWPTIPQVRNDASLHGRCALCFAWCILAWEMCFVLCMVHPCMGDVLCALHGASVAWGGGCSSVLFRLSAAGKPACVCCRACSACPAALRTHLLCSGLASSLPARSICARLVM